MAGDADIARTEYSDTGKLGTPAVGVIATETNSDQVARSLLRARIHGFESLVAHFGNPQLEAVQFAEELGATVVHPSVEDPDREFLRQELAATARAKGFPGLIFHMDLETRIDFKGSIDEFEEGVFVVEAVVESEVDLAERADASVVVGIPAFNEAESIGTIVKEALEYADRVVVADDGSSDGTREVASEAGAYVLEHESNRGYGAALKTLFRYANSINADHLVIMDGDGQHEPADIPKLVETQNVQNAELVIGSRLRHDASTDMPLYRRVGLGVVNLLSNLSFGLFWADDRISDTQSGFRVFDKRAIKTLVECEAISDNMGASTDILHQLNNDGCHITEIGTRVYYDVNDANSINPISHGLSLVSNILRTIENEHPIASIGVPGVLFMLLGIGIGYRTVLLFTANNALPAGHALLSMFFTLIGIFACFTAIILHSLTSKLPS